MGGCVKLRWNGMSHGELQPRQYISERRIDEQTVGIQSFHDTMREKAYRSSGHNQQGTMASKLNVFRMTLS